MELRAAALLFTAASCFAQDAARMDQIVQSYATNNKFMGTALVARDGQALFSKGYGFANLEWNVPNTPDTKFRLGSVTKQFTAASILLLEERGKLSVTDLVKKYLPDAPSAWEKITIRHLLTHTSGIPNFTGFADYRKLEPFPTTATELVARFRDKPLDFQPGEKWSYSNSGYVLLGWLIEKVSGESYEKFVTDNLFTPLGMKDTGYDSNTAIISRRAEGYDAAPNGYQHSGFIHMSVPHAAGGLYSTTLDLIKWEQGLYGGKLLQPASLEKMTTPFLENYAFGLTVITSGGRKRIEHNGGIEGFNTVLTYYPEDKLAVVVLENSVGAVPPGQIAEKLAAVAHGEQVSLTSERRETTIDGAVLRRYVGAYQMPNGGPVMLITLEGSQLSGKLGSQQALPIFAESPTKFFLKAVDAQIEFADGQLTLHQGGRDMVAKKLDDMQAKILADAAAATAQRIKDQTPAPGSDAALRKLIKGVAAGEPDYDAMTTSFADLNRRQLPQLQAAISALGAVQSLSFKAVGPAGPDIYEVKFEKGAQEWRIWLAPDGKVDAANFRPAQ
jgi:CubicO group peptidase (beta-lactamase class C family)